MSVPPNDLDQEWQRLWELAERLAAPTGDDPAYALLPVGLALHGPARPALWEPGDGPSTPANSTVFASTGGDGVHFGMLHHPPVELLAALRRELDLEPWPRVEERLAELRARYLPAVRGPEQR